MDAEASVEDQIRQQIRNNPVLLYMKGSPDAPQCGFSAQAVQVLVACNRPFSYVDVLSHPEVRASLPGIASWPTFPQLWVEGELVGGSDIIVEMYQNGELQPMIEAASEDADEGD